MRPISKRVRETLYGENEQGTKLGTVDDDNCIRTFQSKRGCMEWHFEELQRDACGQRCVCGCKVSDRLPSFARVMRGGRYPVLVRGIQQVLSVQRTENSVSTHPLGIVPKKGMQFGHATEKCPPKLTEPLKTHKHYVM